MRRDSLIGGLHAVTSALREGRVLQLWVMQGRCDRRIQAVLDAAQNPGPEVHRLPKGELDALLPGVRHQGVIACCEMSRALSEGELDGVIYGVQGAPLVLILDGIQDPHNLGACLRSADAAGVHGVIAPKHRAVALTPTARKVASGAAETVPFIQVTNLARTLRHLKGLGLWLVGTAGEAKTSLFEVDLTGPLGLVIGAEGRGLRRLTREHCDRLVYIPMAGSVESLNVSVATGVCLFEAVRQRR